MESPIDAYIAQFPPGVQERLQALRAAIREAAPDAAEKISYRMPTFYLHGNLVHFAVVQRPHQPVPRLFRRHSFAHRLAAYKTSKGTIQFPYGSRCRWIWSERWRYRVDENRRAAEARKKRKK